MDNTDVKIFIVHRTDSKTAQRNSDRRAHLLLNVLLESDDEAEVGEAIMVLGRYIDPDLCLIEGDAGTPSKAPAGGVP